jgi:hypothetical protein
MINVDWNYLRRPMIMFGGAVLIATGLTIAGVEYEQAQEVKYQRALSTLRSTHTGYRKLVNDLALLEQYRTLYNGYKKSGLVGKEHRLSWIESLETTNQVLRLPKLAYSLEPQGGFLRPGFVERPGVLVRSSSMDLTLGLLHEEDLFALLEGLRQSIKNLFTVDSCSLNRSTFSDEPLKTKSANLQAQCRLRWMTIDAK